MSVPDVLLMIRRQVWVVAMCATLAIALAAAFVATTKPLFTATTTVLIDSRAARMFEDERYQSPRDPALESPSIDSQLEIIRSERLALKVIAALDLTTQREFFEPQSQIVSWVRAGIATVKGIVAGAADEPAAPVAVTPRTVLETFADRLSVERVGQTFVLAISFRSQDPERAALIANAMADAYLSEQLDAKYDAVKRATRWLESRIQELRQSVADADQAVQKFKADNNLFLDGQGVLLTDEQLRQLTAQLTEAEQGRMEIRSKAERLATILASGNPDGSLIEDIENSEMKRLRGQYSDASAREAEIAKRYGVDHNAAVTLRRQMAEYERLMLEELKRIADRYGNMLEVANANIDDLERRIAENKSAVSGGNQKQVQLRELERELDTSKELYQTFLERYKSALQQESFPITGARVLNEAAPPNRKSYPKTALVLFLGALGGVALGLGLAMLREVSDRVFRAPAQVEAVTGLPTLGIIPLVKATRPKVRRREIKAGAGQVLPSELGIYRHAVAEPFSRFSETLRAAKISADLLIGPGAKVIGVTSSVPGEGKSVTSMNLGQLLGLSGKSVLVIDADMRSASLSAAVAPYRKVGLVEHLTSGVPRDEIIQRDPVTGICFIPANGKTRIPHTSELIGSQEMAELMAWARETFAYVVVDLPPLGPVVDARVAASVVDQFIYVVEWGRISFATALNALATSPELDGRIMGAVLTKVKVNTMRLYSPESVEAYYEYGGYRAARA